MPKFIGRHPGRRERVMARWSPPSFQLPDQGQKPHFLATVWTEHVATKERGMHSVTGRDEHDLDRKIQEEIGNGRSRGHRPVRTEMTIDGVDWTYEYADDGTIERVFENGEVTP